MAPVPNALILAGYVTGGICRGLCVGVVVTLVDLPGLTAAAIARVMSHDEPVVVATYDGKRGHPVVFNRDYWKDIAKAAKELSVDK